MWSASSLDLKCSDSPTYLHISVNKTKKQFYLLLLLEKNKHKWEKCTEDSSNIPTVPVSFPLSGGFPESSRASSISFPTADSPCWGLPHLLLHSSSLLIHLMKEQPKVWQHRLTPPRPLTSDQTLLCEAPLVIITPSDTFHTSVSTLHSIHSYSLRDGRVLMKKLMERTFPAQCETDGVTANQSLLQRTKMVDSIPKYELSLSNYLCIDIQYQVPNEISLWQLVS